MAKRKVPSFLSTQKEKLAKQLEDKEQQRKRQNIAQYEKEKAERQSRGKNRYFYPGVSVRESLILDYLLGEGFASDEKSAYGIMEGMSEQWIENILDSY